MRLGEHRGGEDSPESGEGTENLDVTVLGKLGVLLQLIDECIDAPGQFRDLLVKQAQMREQQYGGFSQSFGRPGCHGERRLTQQVGQLGGGEAANPVAGQNLFQLARLETGSLGRQRSGLQQGPQPGIVGGRRERQQGREVALQ